MKITISGKPGAGKSVIAKRIAAFYQLAYYSAGDVMRQIAKERGQAIEEFMKVIDEKTEREVDQRTWQIGRDQDNIVFDGRLAFYFIPDSITVFLQVDFDEGAKRIFAHQRDSERVAESVDELAKRNQDRWELDKQRYVERYQVNVDDMFQYHIKIDTTGLTTDQVFERLTSELKDHQGIDKSEPTQ